MSGVSISEIHEYPLKPPGCEEPLWKTGEWRRNVADHLAASRWLCRASEIPRRRMRGLTAHATDEPVYILVRDDASFVVRCRRPDGVSRWRKRRVVEVVDIWREIHSWWDGEDAVDRLVVRVLLAGGRVVDIAKNRPDEWSLVGVLN